MNPAALSFRNVVAWTVTAVTPFGAVPVGPLLERHLRYYRAIAIGYEVLGSTTVRPGEAELHGYERGDRPALLSG